MKVEDISSGPRTSVLVEGRNGKSAQIHDHTGYWQIKYVQNGARKNFDEYHEAVSYLSARGVLSVPPADKRHQLREVIIDAYAHRLLNGDVFHYLKHLANGMVQSLGH